MWEKPYTPLPNHPHIWDTKSEQGNRDIMDIDSNCPYLLFGETTSHLTSKWMRNNYFIFLKKVKGHFGNSMKREETWNFEKK